MALAVPRRSPEDFAGFVGFDGLVGSGLDCPRDSAPTRLDRFGAVFLRLLLAVSAALTPFCEGDFFVSDMAGILQDDRPWGKAHSRIAQCASATYPGACRAGITESSKGALVDPAQLKMTKTRFRQDALAIAA